MPIKVFLWYWVIWNSYWAIPYSFFWQLFNRRGQKWAVSLSMVVFFFIFQLIVPLIVFEHFFQMKKYSSAAIIGSFVVLCIPAMVSNKVISKLYPIKFAIPLLFLLVVLVVILGWLYLWSRYLNSMIAETTPKLCILGFWGVVIPITSSVFIRLFLKTERHRTGQSRNLVIEKNSLTNPPPRGAEGGCGSESSSP